MLRYLPTGVGLASIPVICGPIDRATDHMFDWANNQ